MAVAVGLLIAIELAVADEPDAADVAVWLEEAEALDATVEELFAAGDYESAEARARSSLEIRERAVGPDGLEVATSLNNLGSVLRIRGDFESARPLLERALKISEKALGPDDPQTAAILGSLASLLQNQGHLAEALPLFERSLAIRERALGPDDLSIAISLNNLAGLVQVLGDFDAARSLYERSIAIFEKDGSNEASLATLLNNLATVLKDQGDLDGARLRYERCLAIQERILPPNHPSLAATLNNIGRLHQTKGDYAAARTHFDRSLAILEAKFGPQHPSVAAGVNNVAMLLQAEGDYAGALPFFERALAINEESLGGDHEAVAANLNNLAGLLNDQGEYRLALPLARRSLEIRQHKLGPDHREVAVSLNSIALLLDALGDRAGARPLYERSLAIIEKSYGPNHNDVAFALNNLAVLLSADGDYSRARDLLERALAIRLESRGPDHVEVATSLTNLAVLLDAHGDHAAARPLFERSLAIREGLFGPDHPDLTVSLKGLATHLETEGDFAGARALLDRSVAIATTTYGEGHPMVGFSLNALAIFLYTQGDYEAALPLLERNLENWEATLGEDHPEVATTLNNMAAIFEAQGESARAQELYERGLTIRERAFGPNHPTVGELLNNLGSLRWEQGDAAGARPLLDRSRALIEARFDLIDAMGEREALAYGRETRWYLNHWLTAFDRDGDAGDAWSNALRWKGFVSRRMRNRSVAALAETPEVMDLHAELIRTKAEIAALTYAEYQASATEKRRERIAALTNLKESQERDLAAGSASWTAERESQAAGAEEVCAALADGTGLVDFLRIQKEDDQESTYVAFTVVAPGCEVHRIDLGDASTIDERIRVWRGALAASSVATFRIDQRGGRVTELLWDPIAPSLRDATRLIVIPDSRISAVPFAALPLTSGEYLIERLPIHTLTDAQDLLRDSDPGGVGALAVGGIDYGPASSLGNEGLMATRKACTDDDFPPLKHTAAEAAELSRLWARGRLRKEPIEVLTGSEASEGEISSSMGGHRIVHFATHGFFATGRCKSALQGGDRDRVVGYNPMLLSGLALAGANSRSGVDAMDGILTAEEIGGLDLRGVELVVLSACETGLGEITSGEGVLGLQRGLSVAGVENVVMSLWSVPDEPTKDLMEVFYQGLLDRREPLAAADSLRQAQLQMIAGNRASHEGDTRPASWAAFVVAGRPMNHQ